MIDKLLKGYIQTMKCNNRNREESNGSTVEITEIIRIDILDSLIEYFKKNKKVTLGEFLDSLEKTALQIALKVENGNQRKAAELLGIKPTTFHMKLKKLTSEDV